jgi:glycosyltransferase involved in cell wall biosynthesis
VVKIILYSAILLFLIEVTLIAICAIKYRYRLKDFLKAYLLPAANSAGSGSSELKKEYSTGKKLLVIDKRICTPDQDAGSLRTFYMFQIIRDLGYKITYFLDKDYRPGIYADGLRRIGVEVLRRSPIKSLEQYLKENGLSFDVVMISRLAPSRKYADIVRKYCPRSQMIFDTIELQFLSLMREAELKNDPVLLEKAEKMKQETIETASKFDATLVVSHEEKNILENEAPDAKVNTVSDIQQIHVSGKTFGDRKDLLFIGSFLPVQNVDAMLYFVKEIFPIVRERSKGIKLYIVGSSPPPEITELASEDIIVTGYIKDIGPIMEQCRLSVVPLRFGTGVKGKVNTSMSYGLPVVGTSVAVEGMYLKNGENVLIADTVADFANAVIKLYENEDLWNRLSNNGIENIRRYFSVDAAKKALAGVLEQHPDRRVPDGQ